MNKRLFSWNMRITYCLLGVLLIKIFHEFFSMYMLGPLLSMILILPVLCDGLTAFSVWKGIKIRSALRPCKISSSSQSKAFKAPLLYWTQTYQIRWQSNLHKTRSLCNIIFVTLTCFYLTKKKLRRQIQLVAKGLMQIFIFRGTQFFSCFHQPLCL